MRLSIRVTSTRLEMNSCGTGLRTGRAFAASVGAVLLTVALLAGCSDDIVCPVDESDGDPFIGASILETRLAGGDHASVRVFCTSDPLPAIFVVSVSDRSISEISVGDPLGLIATLEEDAIIWQNGQHCSLKVTTEWGFATAGEPVPGPFSVTQPADVSLGDTLFVGWMSAEDADYYRVECVIKGARGDSIVLSKATTGTTAAFEPADITLPGELGGKVVAVAGPYPGSGTDGNIAGGGWGYFTVSYYDSLSLFELTVADTANIAS